MYPCLHSRRAFSLIELSVVLTIIGLVIGGGVAIGVSQIEQAKTQQTLEKMDEIQKALLSFRRLNNRLPCPNIATLASTHANYGIESDATGGGSCTGSTQSGGVAYGALPAKALGLPVGFVTDGWNNKFTYAITLSYTQTNAFTTNGITSTSGAVVLRTIGGETITDDAIYALVSHGKNASGAYGKTGALKSSISLNTAEAENADGPSANNIFIADELKQNTDARFNYDDITVYKLRLNLLGFNE